MAQTIATTMQALLEAEPALKRLGEVKLPVKTAYHLSKLMSLAQHETKYFYAERDKLIKELGQPKGDWFEVTGDQMPAYIAKINELAALPMTLAWEPLPFTALDGIDMAAGDLLALAPLLAFDEPAKTEPAKRPKPRAVAR